MDGSTLGAWTDVPSRWTDIPDSLCMGNSCIVKTPDVCRCIIQTVCTSLNVYTPDGICVQWRQIRALGYRALAKGVLWKWTDVPELTLDVYNHVVIHDLIFESTDKNMAEKN